jgi:hypothetical protein
MIEVGQFDALKKIAHHLQVPYTGISKEISQAMA